MVEDENLEEVEEEPIEDEKIAERNPIEVTEPDEEHLDDKEDSTEESKEPPIEEPELTTEEKYQIVKNRIIELEEIKSKMDEVNLEKTQELGNIEQKASELRGIINQNIFANTPESQELKELKIVERVLET